MKTISWLRPAYILLVSALVFGGAAYGKEKYVRVAPCPTVSRQAPIVRECVAAAIAEEAFLKMTQHKVDKYMIFSRPVLGPQRKLVVEEGDETHPGADGSHWFVYVNRSSGVVKIVSGR